MTTRHTLTLGGVDRSLYAVQDFNISQEFGRQGDTATINIYDEHTSVSSLNVIPKALDTVLLRDQTFSKNLFGGVVASVKQQWHGPNVNLWNLTCRDYTYYADNVIVVGTFLGARADDIIRLLVAQADCGLTADANLATGPIIPKVQIKYLPLAKAIQNISMLASGAALNSTIALGPAISIKGSKAAEYAWYVDENRDIHWFNSTSAAHSGVTVTDNPPTTGASSTIAPFSREDFGYTWDASNLRTAVLVRGGQFSGGQTDQFVANGAQASWPLTFDLDPNNTTALVVTVGGGQKTVAVYDEASANTAQITTQYAVIQSATGQWFLVVGTDSTPASGAIIFITYTYGGTITARADDFVQQAAFGGPNRGVFEVAIADTTLLSFATALQRAQRDLGEYSTVLEKLTVTTQEDFTGHLRAGDLFTLSCSVTPDMARGYALGVTATFLAQQMRIKATVGDYRTYTITATRVS